VTAAPAPAASGRPLDPELSRAILDATIEVLAEDGYGQLTLGAVAQRAGVHRPAIYRRWPTKVDLVAAAVTSIVRTIPDPATGTVRDDLIEFLQRIARLLQRDRRVRFGFLLMAELAVDPDVVALVNARMVRPWRALVREIVERGEGRGQLRPGVDPEQLSDLLLGALYARALAGRPQPRRAEIEGIVDVLLDGLCAGAAGRLPARRRN
jgi:AcrR family transcriptional regulator